ncbi:MAG TPA: hypothetical protein VGP33_15985 [Chloroflexota bacterium]|nr:hypothetical protein [Chloroflexota bacterium]
MPRSRRFFFAAFALLASLAGMGLAAPATLADNTVTGTLAASPNPSTGESQLWTFIGPADSSTVTLTLTYAPNGNTVDRTGNSYDSLVGFNIYGDDGTLFRQSTLLGTGVRQQSFQSTSTHQYTVQVANYIEDSPVTYSLAIQNATLSGQPTATPTANPLAVQPTSTAAPTVTPLPVVTGAGTSAGLPPSTVPLSPSVLARPGDSVQGSLTGALINTVRDYQVNATPNGSAITLRLTAQQRGIIAGSLAGLNVYQMQGGVKVLIAVGLPAPENADTSVVVFPGDSHGFGNYIAEVYNGDPGGVLDYTVTRQ